MASGDPDGEVYLLIFQQHDRNVASVHETGGDKPVCEEPTRHLSHTKSAVGITLTDTSGKLFNSTLVEKARAEEISFIRELGVWEVVDRPHDEVVFGMHWVDINDGVEHKPF